MAMEISVFRSPSWRPPWPAEDEGAPDLIVRVAEGGRLSLENLRAQVSLRGPPKEWSAFWGQCADTFGRDQEHVGLVEFLLLLQVQKKLRHIFTQLLWAISLKLEYKVMCALKRGAPATSSLQVEVGAIVNLSWNVRRMDQELRKHLASCRRLTAGHLNFTFATDKASVGGPSLQNTLVVLANGSALLQAPQVQLALGFGPGDLAEWRFWNSGGARHRVCIPKTQGKHIHSPRVCVCI